MIGNNNNNNNNIVMFMLMIMAVKELGKMEKTK
jgi:hypothetical protein